MPFAFYDGGQEARVHSQRCMHFRRRELTSPWCAGYASRAEALQAARSRRDVARLAKCCMDHAVTPL